MRVLSQSELGGMERTQEAAMMDTCIIYAYSAAGRDAYGKPAPTYTALGATRCGYKADASTEVLPGNDTATIDATIRLPGSTSINDRDRLELIRRFGRLMVPIMFEVVGQPAPGPSAIVAKVRRVIRGQTS